MQALVLVWMTPYAVECNSITSAVSLGFDSAQCANTCAAGKVHAYFGSPAHLPYTQTGVRLSMLLPVQSVAQAKQLIDRGVQSSMRQRRAAAYLVTTRDAVRSVRSKLFPAPGVVQEKRLTVNVVEADAIENRHDVMFYLTGRTWVDKLDTLTFLPGALADHLTSAGGDLLGRHQMSALRWLDAGATASYGTVSEPCNHVQKFSHPGILIASYLRGSTAIEAYWRSVAWPAQGVFIGEPLAAPYAMPQLSTPAPGPANTN